MPRRGAALKPRAHPLVRELVSLMRERDVGGAEMCEEAGIARNTFGLWGRSATPTVVALEACLGVLGCRLAIVPREEPEETAPRWAGLTPAESVVLAALVRSAPGMKTTDSLLAATGVAGVASLRVLISRLRSKLPSSVSVVSVRGEGYYMRGDVGQMRRIA